MIKGQSLENLRQRVYTDGFRVGDFHEMRPGLVLVEPIKPPKQTAGGVLIPHTVAEDAPSTACLLFRVVATSKEHAPGTLAHAVDDVVILRQAFLDPLNVKQTLLWIKSEHLLSKYAVDHDEQQMKPPVLVADGRLLSPE